MSEAPLDSQINKEEISILWAEISHHLSVGVLTEELFD